jgi:hypothetical protein
MAESEAVPVHGEDIACPSHHHPDEEPERDQCQCGYDRME